MRTRTGVFAVAILLCILTSATLGAAEESEAATVVVTSEQSGGGGASTIRFNNLNTAGNPTFPKGATVVITFNTPGETVTYLKIAPITGTDGIETDLTENGLSTLWNINSGSPKTFSFVAMSDCHVTVRFSPLLILNLTAYGAGTAQETPLLPTYEMGQPVTVMTRPEASNGVTALNISGTPLDADKLDSVNRNGAYAFRMASDLSNAVQADVYFGAYYYVRTADTPNGILTGIGAPSGGEGRVYVKPSIGYMLGSLTVDGVPISQDQMEAVRMTGYTFPSMSQDHLVSGEFVPGFMVQAVTDSIGMGESSFTDTSTGAAAVHSKWFAMGEPVTIYALGTDPYRLKGMNIQRYDIEMGGGRGRDLTQEEIRAGTDAADSRKFAYTFTNVDADSIIRSAFEQPVALSVVQTGAGTAAMSNATSFAGWREALSAYADYGNMVRSVSYGSGPTTLDANALYQLNSVKEYAFYVEASPANAVAFTVAFEPMYTVSIVNSGDPSGIGNLTNGPLFYEGQYAVVGISGARISSVTLSDGITTPSKTLPPDQINFANDTGDLYFIVSDGYTIAEIVFGPNFVVKGISREGGKLYCTGGSQGGTGFARAEADPGYVLSWAAVDGKPLSGQELQMLTGSGWYFYDLQSDHAVEVRFAADYVTMSCRAENYNGMFSEGSRMLVQRHSFASITVRANMGYLIDAVFVRGVDIGVPFGMSEYTGTVYADSDIDVYATFMPISNVYLNPYSHDISIRPGGSMDIGIVVWNQNNDHPVRVKMDSVRLISDRNQEISFEVLGNDSVYVGPKKASGPPAIGVMAISPGLSPTPELMVRVDASQFSSGGDAYLQMTFIVMENPDAGLMVVDRVIMQTCTFALKIATGMIEGESYGKVMGVLPLSEDMKILGEHTAGILTGMIYLAIIAAAAFAVHRLCDRRLCNRFTACATHRYESLVLWMGVLMLTAFAVAHTAYVLGGSYRALAYTKMLFNATVALLAFEILYLAFDYASRRLIGRKGREDSSLPLIAMVAKAGIVISGICVALFFLGLDPFMVFVSLGILSIVFAVGASATLGRMLGGLSVLVTKAYNPGDTVRIDALEEPAVVGEPGILMTQFEDWESGAKYTVPNNTISASHISNVTRRDSHPESVYFRVPYGVDFDRIKGIVIGAAKSNEHVVALSGGEESCVRVVELGTTSILARIAIKTDDFDTSYYTAADVREEIMRRFRENGIEIPYRRVNIKCEREQSSG